LGRTGGMGPEPRPVAWAQGSRAFGPNLPEACLPSRAPASAAVKGNRLHLGDLCIRETLEDAMPFFELGFRGGFRRPTNFHDDSLMLRKARVCQGPQDAIFINSL
jgi:hypothetical protein